MIHLHKPQNGPRFFGLKISRGRGGSAPETGIFAENSGARA